MLMGSTDAWRSRNRILAGVLREMKIPIIPYFGQASFTPWGWPHPVVEPDTERVGGQLQSLLAGLGEFEPVRLSRGNGAMICGFLGNIQGLTEWPANFLYEVLPGMAWFIDRHTVRLGIDHDEQINLFTQPRHLWVTGRTAAVRPGFLHGNDPQHHRFVPRSGGKPWRSSIRSVLSQSSVKYLFIESEGEYMEGSSILPCSPRQSARTRAVHPDRWGRGPRRYLKILRQEIRRANR
jgi:hypothetical protein